MRKTALLKQLYSTAEHLRPLAQTVGLGDLIWDGTQYVQQEPKEGDPAALSWFVRLTTMAALIEAQESPLSIKQITYLKRTLLGGMGSLLDVQFDSKDINEKLGEGTHALFVILSGDLTED